MNTDKIVSFEDEKLIVVDENDNIIDFKSKAECHDGNGILHRAFSIFIFNNQGQLLMQKRSKHKRLWPLFWSNSCCSHPRQGESYEYATGRRLKEELGIEANLKYLYKFQYQAKFGDIGSEFELCSVYIGKSESTVFINKTEIDDWKYTTQDDLNKHLASRADEFTPWFKMEWEQIKSKYLSEVKSL